MREKLRIAGEEFEADVRLDKNTTAKVWIDENEYSLECVERDGPELTFKFDGRQFRFHVLATAIGAVITDGKCYYVIERIEEGAVDEQEAGDGQLVSQMPGTVLKLLCKPGDQVTKGEPLLILEAMKMEHEVCAPADGAVEGYPYQAGERVMPGDLLVNFAVRSED